MMNDVVKRLKETKVLENYSFMTALNVLSALIGFIIYPYVVRVIGKDAFGVYPYALVWVGYAQLIIDFGLDAPATKLIVKHKDNADEKQHVLSVVFTIKVLLSLISTILFAALIFSVGSMREYWVIYLCAFLQNYSYIFNPTWYFQGLKNMKIVTYINLICRLFSIPFILLLLHSGSDLWIYALITSVSMIFGGIITSIYIRVVDGLKIRLLPVRQIIPLLKEGMPFFLTGIAGQLKEGLMTTIVKLIFGYGDVTLYDIAKKIITIPRMLTQNINAALFPEVIDNFSKQRVKRILKYERWIGLSVVALVIAFSYPLILLLFGEEAIGAFPLTAILSLTIYTWLIVGVYLNFVFIPNNKYYYITINQVIALLSSVVLTILGLLVWRNFLMVVIAITAVGFIEILFCRTIAKKNNML